MEMSMSDYDSNTITQTRSKVKKPSMYTAVFLNDDYTTQQFVVQVLIDIFNQSEQDAIVIMMKVHKEGKSNVGSYTFEVAEHKATQTVAFAQKSGFPLQVKIEPI